MMSTLLFCFVTKTTSFTGGSVPAPREINRRDSSQLCVSISKPAIHWTVPGFKTGWKDDDGNWFDKDGPRNGPPLNYWRQRADEREYDQAMGAIDAVLSECEIESEVLQLEKRSSVRKPSLSRKMLGRWAPLLLSSRRIDLPVVQANHNGEPPGDVEVPFLIDISRSTGRKFGPRNHYGIFDLTVENGEKLSISTRGGGTDYVNISTEITADEANEPVNLGTAGRVQLQFGGITYVSDYVMIQRRPDGSIDFYLRADESYLGY